jgi:hypothetical protein
MRGPFGACSFFADISKAFMESILEEKGFVMEIKNMTSHAINLLIDGMYVEYPPTGVVPRIATIEADIDGCYPFAAVKVLYGDIQDLPEPEDNVILIVSKMCCDARPNRPDLWYPTRLVRDEGGRIVGCDALAHL